MQERILGGVVGRPGFGALGLDFGGLGLRVAGLLFLLEQGDVGLRPLESVFGLFDLTGRGGALLLEPAQGIETAPGDVEGTVRLRELGIEGEDFLARASGCQSALVGCGGGDLRVSACGLGANVGVIEL